MDQLTAEQATHVPEQPARHQPPTTDDLLAWIAAERQRRLHRRRAADRARWLATPRSTR